MSIFEDKQYEEMDWLTKAIEPTISSMNDKLHSLPEVMEFTPLDLLNIIQTSGYLDLDMHSFFGILLLKHNIHLTRWYSDYSMLMKCFEMRISSDIIINFETNEVSGGNISLHKIKTIFEEVELVPLLGRKGIDSLRSLDSKNVPIDRANEIAELLGANEATSKRSSNQKIQIIINSLSDHLANNKWNIKNIDLGDKVCLWVRSYLEKGNLAALTNFCKFKVMTHSGDPIYSIEEELL